ncbi:carbohydrate ABC transporter permease [Microbacterium paraoxydans]|uniref:Carbohydrate ABC transporter permease n=1 Tax=Microbacterium paraoxydans TaxID=199592 RepID=A0ABS5ILC0_9MICO|nr:carbohydrate ABC transporter permease [Microbacterium paraoxydans]MBS0023748.1 carbohydrate ABC transporter permease [Microbacterium paraoxydans]
MTVLPPTVEPRTDVLTRVERQRRRRRHRPTVGGIIVDVVLVVFGILMLSPLFWLIVQSFTEPEFAFADPPRWLPIPFTTQNFADVFEYMPFFQQFGNSLALALISTIGALFFSVLAAYAFARIDFRGSRVLLVIMLSALMVPGQLVIIPIFIMMRQLGLVDTLASLWLPALINVFQIFFLSQYFKTIPRELDEAARLDGAGHLWILFRMLIPLSAPAVAALAILGFEASWNGYFGPLIFLSSPENMTLPLGLVTLQNGFGAAPAVIVFAAITLVVVPLLVVFLAFQRQIVESVASTGLKG